MLLRNIILPPSSSSDERWDIAIQNHKITSITTHQSNKSSATDEKSPSLLLPSLCHPHIHLDKAYLLNSNSNRDTCSQCSITSRVNENKDDFPDYSSHEPETGSFKEALSLTAKSKSLYTPTDLLLRGAQLLATSLAQGVTSCRAFVEVDHDTKFMALEAGLELKNQFEGNDAVVRKQKGSEDERGSRRELQRAGNDDEMLKMRVQICAFAQDPVFSTEYGDENRRLMEQALETYTVRDQSGGQGRGQGVEVLGSTPYVETTTESSRSNIDWAIRTALKYDLHLDFHLDYNLDPNQKAMVWDVINLLRHHKWAETQSREDKKAKTVVLGHCTRLTLFTSDELSKLAAEIRKAGLQDLVSFVGLPTSDLFMMGRPESQASATQIRPRGTLHLPTLHSHGLNAVIGMNNVGNAFTPWGTGDPLALASLAVGLYQIGIPKDAEVLYDCVSERAKKAIGLSTLDNSSARTKDVTSDQRDTQTQTTLMIREGTDLSSPENALLLIRNEKWALCPGRVGLKIPARQRLSVKDVVWDPPGIHLRRIVR